MIMGRWKEVEIREWKGRRVGVSANEDVNFT